MIDDDKLIEGMTPDQVEDIKLFQAEWSKFLSDLGVTFYGPTASNAMIQGAQIMHAVMQAVFQTAVQNCRGTLNQNRMVMIFGFLSGSQLAAHLIAEGKEKDDDLVDSGTRMFWAAFRVGMEAYFAGEGGGNKPRLYGVDGSLLM